jgi:hypothetical protein
MPNTTRSFGTTTSQAAPNLSAMLSMLAGATIIGLAVWVWPVRNFLRSAGTRVAGHTKKLGSFG